MSPHNQTIAALCELMKTGDEADRCYSARALGAMKAEAAVDALIERLRDEDIDVCVDAAEALGKIGAVEATTELIASLENDPSGEICTAIAAALGKIGGDRAASALRQVAAERPAEMEWDDDWDTWWNVQLEAVKALGNFGDKQAVETLINILQDESQQDIESEILSSLARIPGEGTAFLMDRLQDRESLPQHRRRAVRALGNAQTSSQVIQALGRAMQDPAPEVRAEAASALAAQGASRYLRALILMMRDPADEVRTAAIDAVLQLSQAKSSDDSLRDELLAMLADPSSQVRGALFDTLASMTEAGPLPEEAFRAVVAGLDDPSAETAASACLLLGNNGDPKAVPELLRILNNHSGHPMVRREAALTIGRLRHYDQEVADSLSRAVGDQAQAVRLGALSALMALESSTETDTTAGVEQSPLDIILAAVNGGIELSHGKPIAESAADEDEATDAVEEAATEDSGRVDDTVSDDQGITLPDSPGAIVQEGEIPGAGSTLDAIAMDNVQVALGLSTPQQEPEHDQVTREYLQVVDDNKETMARIRSQRKIDTGEDVRRLGTRILAESDRDEALQALILTLSEDDPMLRREAAESIGNIALRGVDNPLLMDAVGTLITQLAVGDLDQRLACARALGYLGNRAALVPLIESLKDRHPNVRIQAIEALTRIAMHGADPDEADHMVVRNLPPMSVARKILECMDDSEMGVRVGAARNLSSILMQLQDDSFTDKVVEKIIASVSQWTGEEARLIGQALRTFDLSLSTGKLLTRLEQADDSVKRSVIIEMLEELLTPTSGQPDEAA